MSNLARITRAVPALRTLARGMSSAKKIDDRMIGEWPEVPEVYAQTQDPFKFWDQQERRNFGQLHEQDEALGVWMWDTVSANGTLSPSEALKQLCVAFVALAGVFGISVLYNAPARNPTDRAMPFNHLYEVDGFKKSQ